MISCHLTDVNTKRDTAVLATVFIINCIIRFVSQLDSISSQWTLFDSMAFDFILKVKQAGICDAEASSKIFSGLI